MGGNVKWLLFMACIWPALLAACSPAEEPKVQAKKPIPVQIVEIKARDLPVVVESVGRLMANRQVTLAAEVGGVAAGYKADVGDKVRAGQVLVTIDPADYRLALAEARAGLAAAEAQLSAAEKTFNRSQKLLPRQVISQESFDKAEAGYKTAKAGVARAKVVVDIARSRLNKTIITAPFPGLVSARMVEVGQTLGPGRPVMTLVDINPVRVKVYVSERDYVYLDREDPVSIMVEAYPQRVFQGQIDRNCIQADPQTNMFCLEVLLDNPDLVLKPGLTARVRITARVIREAILVPQSAVLYREDRREVFVAGPGGTAEGREVKLARADGSLIRISKGLKPGDRLIVTGQQYLKPGDKITVAAEERDKAR